MSDASSRLQMVQGEEVLHRKARALIGWMSEPEAITTLLGRTALANEDLSGLRKRHAEAQLAVSRLDIRQPEDPVMSDSDPLLTEIRSRPEVAANFQGMDWRPAMVDLRRVLTFQKIIFTDGLDERLRDSKSPDGLFELCLPRTQPTHPLGAFTDPDGKGFTISSFNPNLRIAAGQVSEANVSPGPMMPSVRMQAVTLLVYMGTSYLQVVRYRDRCFVRDGYHRATGLLRSGIYEAPCIFIEATSFEQVGAGMVPGVLSYEAMYSPRPPYLSDFWDDRVAADVSQPAVRKVVRIRGEEFVVPR
jgi:hypothetical protein